LFELHEGIIIRERRRQIETGQIIEPAIADITSSSNMVVLGAYGLATLMDNVLSACQFSTQS